MASAGPQDAFTGEGGVRMYSWAGGDTALNRKYNATAETVVLSVTSIRKLCGESFNLVNWQLANITNVAMGQRRIEWIGPRGGHRKGYAKDGEFPGQFVQKLIETNGDDAKMVEVRQWLRAVADEPRDFPAIRGTMIHEAVEMNVPLDRVDDNYITAAIARLSARDRAKVKNGMRPEDIPFIKHTVKQYWHLRDNVAYVIIAREPQIWNLTAGYAGSLDVLIWFLGHFEDRVVAGTEDSEEPVYKQVFIPLPGYDPATPEGQKAIKVQQKAADKGAITQADIDATGGHVVLGDYKTSEGVYTDQVTQVTAYIAGEFIAAAGIIDERLTAILRAIGADQNEPRHGALIHLRPDGWQIHFVGFEQATLFAFLGSCAFARYLAQYPSPDPLFKGTIQGSSPEEIAE
jgi:hypothetical protein